MAEIVASELREEILRGDLSDGSPLPNQDVLSERFGVSKASLREAMRILESERLITVRRGRHGGVIVHSPTETAAAYTLGLMLHTRNATTVDVVTALGLLETLCVWLCASRKDRRKVVVPRLKEAIEMLEHAVDADPPQFAEAEQAFHERIVESCGNPALASVVGVLESLWRWQSRDHLETAARTGVQPNERLRHGGLAAHREVLELIERGDAMKAATAMQQHHRDTFEVAHRKYVDHPIRVTTPNSEAMRSR